MRLDLHIDLQKRTLIPDPDTRGAVSLQFVQGDTYQLVLHGWRPTNDSSSFSLYTPASIEWHSLSAGVLLIDAAPKGGKFKVKIGVDVTDWLAWDIAAAALSAALNALPAVLAAGGIEISATGKSHFYLGQWTVPENALPIEFPVDDNKLIPLCIPVAREDDSISGKVNIKLVRAPVAFTDQFTLPMPPGVTCTRVRAGSVLRNEVQRITVPSGATGSFALESGKILPVATVTAPALADSLNAKYVALDAADLRFAVTARDRGLFDVEFIGAFSQTACDLLVVEMFDQVAIDTPTASIPFTASAIEDQLEGARDSTLVFEVVAADEAGREDTIVQQECKILNDGLNAGVGGYLSSVATRVDTVYVYPAETDPVVISLIGQRFETPATSDSFVYTHNFNTLQVEVVCLERLSTAPDKFRQVSDDEFEMDVINPNQVEVYFGREIPAVPSIGSVEVWVRSLNAVPIVNNHRHPTSQIDGEGEREGKTLAEIIEELYNSLPDDWPNIPANKISGLLSWDQISGLIPDAKMPATVPRLNSEGKLDLSTIPLSVPRVDPATGELVYWGVDTGSGELVKRVIAAATGLFGAEMIGDLSRIPGFGEAVKKILAGGGANALAMSFVVPSWNELYPGRAKVPAKSEDIVAADLPKPGGLLPAVHDAVIADLTVPLPTPGEPYTGNVFLNASGADVAIPSGLGRKGTVLKKDAHAACDGRLWYRVAQEGATTSYHPMDFDRELVMLDVNESMLPVGGIFTLLLDFETQILRSDLHAQWVVVVETGVISKVAVPAGKNISGITWSATPVIEAAIRLTPIRTPHTFGVRFTRAEAGITGETKLYRAAWAATATVPAGPGFALRARLCRFDTEDGVADPRGYVLLSFNPNKTSLATVV